METTGDPELDNFLRNALRAEQRMHAPAVHRKGEPWRLVMPDGTVHRRPEGSTLRFIDRIFRELGWHCWDCFWHA